MCAAAKEAYTRDKAKWDALSPEQKLTSEAQVSRMSVVLEARLTLAPSAKGSNGTCGIH